MDFCNQSLRNKQISSIFLYLICFLSIIYLVPYLIKHNYTKNITKKFHYSCLCECENFLCKYLTTSFRSSSYFINDMIKEINPENVDQRNKYQSTCILSGWGMSHVIFYVMIGLLLPNHFYQVLLGGILFEIIEHYVWDCGDIFDILWNMFGFLLGKYIHNNYLCA